MSKSKDDKAAAAAAMKPIALPTLPKCDEGNRNRWATDYDKVENELLKTHLGGSATLGLRHIPGEWDRTVPAADTEVEDGFAPVRRRARGGNNTSPVRSSTTEPHVPHGGAVDRASPKRPMSARSVMNASAPLSTAHESVSVREMLSVLFTLLDPPLRFRTQINVDTEGIDISWLRHFVTGDRTPAALLTLDTVREDMFINPSARHETAITSPRSVIVMLRNGVTVSDLQARPVEHFQTLGVSEATADAEFNHYEERRTKLLDVLRTEYRELSAKCSTFALLDEVSDFRAKSGGKVESSYIKEKKQKMNATADANRDRLAKTTAVAEQMQERTTAAAHRRRGIERELLQKRSDDRNAALDRHNETARRAADMRADLLSKSAAMTDAAEERRQRLESHERAQKTIQAAQQHRKKQEQAKKTAVKQARIAANRAALETQQEELEAKRETDEARAREFKAKRDQEMAAQAIAIADAQQRAEHARANAKEMSRRHDEEVRQEADDKREHAESRLRAFATLKQKQQAERRSQDQQRREARKGVHQAARQREEHSRSQSMLKMQQQEDSMATLQYERSRAAELDAQRRHLTQNDKRYLVDRQSRATGYNRLVSIAQIVEKDDAATAISTQRQRLIHASRVDRENTRVERELALAEAANRSLRAARAAMN
jgi:hypothetical protein